MDMLIPDEVGTVDKVETYRRLLRDRNQAVSDLFFESIDSPDCYTLTSYARKELEVGKDNGLYYNAFRARSPKVPWCRA